MRDIYVWLTFGPERRVEIAVGPDKKLLVFNTLLEARAAEPLARKSIGGATWVSVCLVEYFAAHPILAIRNEQSN